MISTYIHNNYNDITTLQNGWMLFVHGDTKNVREKKRSIEMQFEILKPQFNMTKKANMQATKT